MILVSDRKKATESYWKAEITLEALKQAGAQIRKDNWLKLKETGIDYIPSNDFSFRSKESHRKLLEGGDHPRGFKASRRSNPQGQLAQTKRNGHRLYPE